MDAFDTELLKIFKNHNPDVKPDEVDQWSKSHSHWASKNYWRSAQWIDATLRFLDKNLDDVDVERFIINVYGVALDIPEIIQKKTKVFTALGFASHSEVRKYVIRQLRDRGMQIHILQLLQLDEVLGEFVEQTFSTEELFAIAYYRNSYCHPWLSAYTVKLSSKKKGVKFDPGKYEAFLKIQPYDDLDLCKGLHEKLNQRRDSLNRIKDLLLALKN